MGTVVNTTISLGEKIVFNPTAVDQITASLKSSLVHFCVGRCGQGLRIVGGAIRRLLDSWRTVVRRASAAPVPSAAPKKKAFDRGSPVWPPRSNAKYDRLGGSAPSQNRILFEIIRKTFEKICLMVHSF